MPNNKKIKLQLISTKLKKARMLHAMERSLSNISASAQYAKISRNTHYRWLKEDEKYREGIDEIREVTLDFTELQLRKLITNGNTKAIIFHLNCLGKNRGYGKITKKS